MRIFLAILMAAMCVGLVGCNTVAGAGKDVQKAGEAIEDSAQDAKN